jgi:hypothetical protein
MTFEGKDQVLKVIDRRQIKTSTLKRINDFLNREVEINVSALALTVLLASVLVKTNISSDVEMIKPYTITVVDERGHYEVY